MTTKITIMGGGIAGLTTAIALNKIGISTLVFEAAPAVKAIGAGLGLGANAIMAFSRIGIMDEVIQRGRILPSFSIYDQKGKLIVKTDSKQVSEKYGVDNFTIHRAALHQLLLSKIEDQSVYTNKRVIDFKQKENSVILNFQDGSTHETEFLIVADGIHSLIRKKLVPHSEPRYAGYTCWRAIIDNTNLKLSESSETWGTKGRFGIVPLADNKIYWFACINANANDANLKNYKVKDILNHFSQFHEPILTVIKETKDENLLWNDIIDLNPIHHYAFGNILLIGDAAHATTPNMGQGACQAIEDAIVLANELSKNKNIKQAFKNFEARRIKRTHYITTRSWQIGKIAQLENKLLAGMRDFAFRLMPQGAEQKQFEKLYKVDF